MNLTKGKIVSAQKIVVYGPEGIGKSTFASKFPGAVFIDTEGSTKQLDVTRTDKPTYWEDILYQVDQFKKNPHLCQTLIIDTADWAERLCVTSLCETAKNDGLEDFGYGKGYTYLEEEFGRFLDSLEELIATGINVVITAHAKMRKVEQPDAVGGYDRWEIKTKKTTAPLLKEWADAVLFANYETIVVNVDNQGAAKGKNKATGGKRIMYTTHHPCWDAKNRYGLPDKVDFDYKVIAPFIKSDGVTSPAPAKTEPIAPKKKDSKKKNDDTAAALEKALEKNSTPIEFDAQDMPATEKRVEGIPEGLQKLMADNNVTEKEIQTVVAAKGYYPEDTPIANYEPEFIQGVLVVAWKQVFDMIGEVRSFGKVLPF